MAVLKSHQFWLGVVVGLILVGFIPSLNIVGKFKGGSSKS